MAFVVAVPFRSVCDDQARVLARRGLLRLYAVWNRRGTEGIPAALTRRMPLLGLVAYAGARSLSPYRGESLRCALYPAYDLWVRSMLRPGDSVLSSYGYANACFRYARSHGGSTWLDAGNSHPAQFWEILEEEYRRWGCGHPPIARFHHERSLRMMDDVDHVLAPSRYVAESFLSRGFSPEQVTRVIYPVDLGTFLPDPRPRPPERPLTLINTGGVNLRKGTPYLLDAFRRIRKQVPDARLLLTDLVSDNMRPLLPRYSDLPIEWAPPLPHARLAERLRSADVFLHPSLEEGLVRTALEAMASGLPVVLTPHCGADDFVREGVNGSVVPIRDPRALADAVLGWWERVRSGYRVPVEDLGERLSIPALEGLLLGPPSPLLPSAGSDLV